MEQAGEILLHIEPVGAGCGRQGVEDGAGLGPFDRSGKQPVFPANTKRPDGVLRPVVVNGHIRRFQEPHQIFLLGYQVPDGFGQLATAGGLDTLRQAKNSFSRGFSSVCRFSIRSSGGHPANCRSRP